LLVLGVEFSWWNIRIDWQSHQLQNEVTIMKILFDAMWQQAAISLTKSSSLLRPERATASMASYSVTGRLAGTLR
jgi:hypothetical protein